LIVAGEKRRRGEDDNEHGHADTPIADTPIRFCPRPTPTRR
jgi:hypothetical protein